MLKSQDLDVTDQDKDPYYSSFATSSKMMGKEDKYTRFYN